MKRTMWVVGAALAVGCGDMAGSPAGPSISISVAPLDIIDHGPAFSMDLRVVGRDGEVGVEVEGIHAGNPDVSASYVMPCGAPEGQSINRFDFALHGPSTNTAALPSGLASEVETSFGFDCRANQDTRVGYHVALATSQRGDDDVTAIAFDDIRCEASQVCAPDAVGVQIVCNSAGGPTALGVRDVRLACGGYTESLAAIGESDIRVGGSAAAANATLDGVAGAAWSARVVPPNLRGCELQADVIAAHDLEAGQVDQCTAWPVMKVRLPLTPVGCRGGHVEVGYAEAGGRMVDAVIDATGVKAPTPRAPSSCFAAPVTFGGDGTPHDGTNIVRDVEQGFVDFELTMSLPE